MICSIIQLPEFSKPGTVIHGFGHGGIVPTESETDCPDLSTGGRDICIASNMRKYKLSLTLPASGRSYSIIFIALDEITIDRNGFLRSSPGTEIFPVYLREHVIPGAMKQLKSNVVLSMYGCNRLFVALNLHQVASVADAIKHVIYVCGLSDYASLPKYIREDMVDRNYGTLATVSTDLVNSINSCDTDMHLDAIVEHGCILKGYIPFEVDAIMHMHTIGQIMSVMDPVHIGSPIEVAMRQASETWSALYTWIHHLDDDYPRYVIRDDAEEIEDILYHSSCFESEEFALECPPSGKGFKTPFWFDTLNLKRHGTYSPDIYSRSNMFARCIRNHLHLDLNYKNDSLVRAEGSYLEDLVVTDARGEIVAYFDLVWWILARGSGLLNESTVYI